MSAPGDKRPAGEYVKQGFFVGLGLLLCLAVVAALALALGGTRFLGLVVVVGLFGLAVWGGWRLFARERRDG